MSTHPENREIEDALVRVPMRSAPASWKQSVLAAAKRGGAEEPEKPLARAGTVPRPRAVPWARAVDWVLGATRWLEPRTPIWGAAAGLWLLTLAVHLISDRPKEVVRDERSASNVALASGDPSAAGDEKRIRGGVLRAWPVFAAGQSGEWITMTDIEEEYLQ